MRNRTTGKIRRAALLSTRLRDWHGELVFFRRLSQRIRHFPVYRPRYRHFLYGSREKIISGSGRFNYVSVCTTTALIYLTKFPSTYHVFVVCVMFHRERHYGPHVFGQVLSRQEFWSVKKNSAKKYLASLVEVGQIIFG